MGSSLGRAASTSTPGQATWAGGSLSSKEVGGPAPQLEDIVTDFVAKALSIPSTGAKGWKLWPCFGRALTA